MAKAAKRTAAARSRATRKYDLRRRYGLDEEGYNALLSAQAFRCASCGSPSEEQRTRFSVDHDHRTGEIRGLLCHSCNLALGHLQDDPVRVERLLNYLRRWLLQNCARARSCAVAAWSASDASRPRPTVRTTPSGGSGG